MYVGEYKNGNRHGKGTYTHANGDKYVGDYNNDKRTGQGTYTYPSGDKYVGEYKDALPHGQGTYIYANGDKYKGVFINNNRTGLGSYWFSNGDEYLGEFKNGKLHGQGTYTYVNGSKKVGEWKNDKLNGYAVTYHPNGNVNKEGIFKDSTFLYAQTKTLPACPTSGYFHNCIGTIIYPEGDKYIGEWQNDKRNGRGTYTYAGGNKYLGEWQNGKKSGQGTFTWANGEKYVGAWETGERNGQGTYTWANGEKYVGQYKNDKRNGQGTFTWANGDKYVGEFKNGKRTGQGTFTWADGDKYIGEFKNGKVTNHGTYTWASGNKYVGQYKNEKRNGQGTFTWASGNKYVGEFKDDKRNGQGTFTYADGSKEVGTWGNSELNGYAIKYFANGTIDKEGIFKDDEFLYSQTKTLPACPTSGYFHNCFGTFIYSEGDKYIGEWQDDKKNGQGTYTWADGDKYVGEYKNDKQNGQGTYTFGSNSQWAGDKYVGEFKDNLYSGQGAYTWANGRKEVGTYENNKLNGYAIKYFANGAIDKEGTFKDDEFLYAKDPPPSILDPGNEDNKVINASSGSGFAVSSDGYVITNNHVIEGCQEVIVHTKEKDIKTRIISFDPQNDLALLKGDFRPKTVFALSNNRPELLQDIYVAGYPFGNAISSSIKVTKGIISSLTGIGNNFSNIQIDAALQSGNSGGPIIDDNGNVIAVAVSKLDAKYMLENYGSIPENTNFGIKSSVVKSILDSNDVARPDANQSVISKTRLGKMISSGTYYISCWMTQAQIELLKSKKVLFEELN